MTPAATRKKLMQALDAVALARERLAGLETDDAHVLLALAGIGAARQELVAAIQRLDAEEAAGQSA